MDNLSKIKKFSKNFHMLLSFLLVAIPSYYFSFWVFINYLPETLVTVNGQSTSLISNDLSIKLQIIGIVVSLFPLSALIYGLLNLRKLFAFYKEGIIFSFEHVRILKKNSQSCCLVGCFIHYL